MTGALLEIEDLAVQYGEIRALRGVSLDVRKGEVVAIVGANGAGKTTLLRTISGLVRAARGRISFAGAEIRGLRADQIVARGVIHCPEGRAVLGRMTVAENLEMGAYRLGGRPDLGAGLADVFRLFPRLAERREQLAVTLSGGEQQMLALGRALMAKPELMIIDEPSLGLAPMLVADVFRFVRELKRRGLTVLLVEQNAMQALRCADRGYVLEMGEIRFGGTAADLLADARVRAAYLGEGRSGTAQMKQGGA
ncbi:MAG: ABC transporter ATP-binding protein [Rhodospirillaceae bacterium]|nr:ABC transporter ATP-binding protein [Rhodospirillaceae bacterium]